MEVDNIKFDKTKSEAKDYYGKLDQVKCPYLQKDVHFNEEGFSHLLSKAWNCGRSQSEQYIRLRILPKVVDVVKLSHTLQEYDERKLFVRQKTNSRWEKTLKTVRYYVFISLLKDHDLRLKVVVKEIEGGQPFFWSVYPSWKVAMCADGIKKKIFYSGNLEED